MAYIILYLKSKAMKKIIITLAVIFAAIAVQAQTVTVSDSIMSISIKKTAANAYHVDFKAGRAAVSGNYSVVFDLNEYKLTHQRTTNGVYDCEFSLYFDSLFDAYTIEAHIYIYTIEDGWKKIAVISRVLTPDQYKLLIG